MSKKNYQDLTVSVFQSPSSEDILKNIKNLAARYVTALQTQTVGRPGTTNVSAQLKHEDVYMLSELKKIVVDIDRHEIFKTKINEELLRNEGDETDEQLIERLAKVKKLEAVFVKGKKKKDNE